MRARVKGAPMKCGVCREPLRFEAGKGYVHVIKCHVRDHLAMPRRT
jgi:LSD1 subclass zinc finger protein